MRRGTADSKVFNDNLASAIFKILLVPLFTYQFFYYINCIGFQTIY